MSVLLQGREEADKFNAADALIFTTEKNIKEYGDKIPADKKQVIDEALASLKTAHQNKDFAAIDSETEKLNTAWNAASQDIYQAQQQTQGGENAGQENTGNAESKPEDNVQDVEFEEVK